MQISTWLPPRLVVPLMLSSLAPSDAAAQAREPPAMSTLEQEISGTPPAPTAGPGGSAIDKAVAARDYERAERLLADAIARQPASRQLLTQIANVFMMDRKPLNAAIALKKAEALGPLDTHARLQLALAYIAMKRGDWARPELERLSVAEPANVTYPYWLARLDYDAGQYAAAIRRLQSVVAQAPAFTRAHDNLGLCYDALNQPDEAIRHYREAVRLNRVDGTARSGWPALNLGILLRTRGEPEEAEALFREALTYDRHFAPAYYQLGAILEQRGRMDEAVKALRQATSADAAYAEPYYALSRVYRRQGRTAEADEAMTTFKRLHDARREPAR
jgi:tetratricopeptide (TPR) repeat protein